MNSIRKSGLNFDLLFLVKEKEHEMYASMKERITLAMRSAHSKGPSRQSNSYSIEIKVVQLGSDQFSAQSLKDFISAEDLKREVSTKRRLLEELKGEEG